MTGRTAFAAALSGGVTVALFVRALFPGPARVAARVRPYVQLSRSRLGVGDPDVRVLGVGTPPRSAIVEVLGPMVVRAAELLGRLMDSASEEAISLRLRHAGYRGITVEEYRQRQLSWTLSGAAVGSAIGLLGRGSSARVLLLTVMAAAAGATGPRMAIERSVRERRRRMTTDLYTVCQLLAVHARNRGPIEAVREVVAIGGGPVVDELAESLDWIRGGTASPRAYERLSDLTPDEFAARLYRLLGSGARSGGDIVPALLALADDVRNARRDEVERLAVRRRALMLIPLLALIAPVLILFLAAALPHVLFGSFR